MVKRPYFLVLIFLAVFGLVSCQDSNGDDQAQNLGDTTNEGSNPIADDYPLDYPQYNEPDYINLGGNSSEAANSTDYELGATEDEPLPVASEPIETVKKKTKKLKAAPPTCGEILIATKENCFANIPAGYDPAGCVFSYLENADCNWKFLCTATITEAPIPTSPPESSSSSSSSSSSAESCEVDRKISFSNSFVNVKGFVKHSRAPPCDD